MSETEARLRAALEALLPWADTYEDHMTSDAFDRRDAATLFAHGVLAGDTEITLEGALEQVRAQKAERAASGPRIEIRSPIP